MNTKDLALLVKTGKFDLGNAIIQMTADETFKVVPFSFRKKGPQTERVPAKMFSYHKTIQSALECAREHLLYDVLIHAEEGVKLYFENGVSLVQKSKKDQQWLTRMPCINYKGSLVRQEITYSACSRDLAEVLYSSIKDYTLESNERMIFDFQIEVNRFVETWFVENSIDRLAYNKLSEDLTKALRDLSKIDRENFPKGLIPEWAVPIKLY